jgi:hypothetical protein
VRRTVRYGTLQLVWLQEGRRDTNLAVDDRPMQRPIESV